MTKQEKLFEEFLLLGKSFQNLGGIVQNTNQETTWQEVEEFDLNLDILLKKMQHMRMKTILHLRDEGLIKS